MGRNWAPTAFSLRDDVSCRHRSNRQPPHCKSCFLTVGSLSVFASINANRVAAKYTYERGISRRRRECAEIACAQRSHLYEIWDQGASGRIVNVLLIFIRVKGCQPIVSSASCESLRVAPTQSRGQIRLVGGVRSVLLVPCCWSRSKFWTANAIWSCSSSRAASLKDLSSSSSSSSSCSEGPTRRASVASPGEAHVSLTPLAVLELAPHLRRWRRW
jgi:hypothetical protein